MANYQALAKEARKKVLEMIHSAGTSHIGSNFSVIDIATVLYENVDLKKDRVVWSAGWKAATIYYFLEKKGVLPTGSCDTFCKPGSQLIGLAEDEVPGVHASGGAMGHGLPVAVGMAYELKRQEKEGTVFCVMSDGEMDEGTTWEAAALAAHHKLDNLVVLIDKNNWQAMGRPGDILNMEPLGDKWESFGWEWNEHDGHDFEIIEAVLRKKHSQPYVFIAETTKGKGVSFMEDAIIWHYSHVDDETYKKAMAELE